MLSEKKVSRDSPTILFSSNWSLSTCSSSSGQLSSFKSVFLGHIEVRSSMSGSSNKDRMWGRLHGEICGEPSLAYVGSEVFFSSLRHVG